MKSQFQYRDAARELSVKSPLATTREGARNPFLRIDPTG